MNAELAIELVKGLLYQAVALATPVLIAGMSVGLMISLFQAVTSIHEQTLAFVPKALAIVGVMVALLPWMTRTLMEYTVSIMEKMPQMAH